MVKILDRIAEAQQDSRDRLLERDELILQATDQGFSTREIGRATGLSHQRVAQIAFEQEVLRRTKPEKEASNGS